jgi:hypothetical protein
MKNTIRKKERKNWFYSYNMIFDQPISEHAKIVYLYLCRCADSEGQAFPSYSTIAKKCSISRRTAINAINELKQARILSVEERVRADGSLTSNLYTIYDEPQTEKIESKNTLVQDVHHPSAPGAPPLVQDVHHPSAPGAQEVLPTEGLPIINNNIKSNKNEEVTNTQTKDDVVVNKQVKKIYKELKPQIDNQVGKISKKQLTNLIEVAGPDAIYKQLDSYPKFKETQKIMNPVGFFIRAVIEDWSAPVPSIPNRTNSFGAFEQHEYTEEDLEALFERIE